MVLDPPPPPVVVVVVDGALNDLVVEQTPLTQQTVCCGLPYCALQLAGVHWVADLGLAELQVVRRSPFDGQVPLADSETE